jgi:hypothetical protein
MRVALGLILVAFVALHAAGGRAATSAFSGTELDGMALGLAYALAYLTLMVVAPIVAIAMALRAALERVWPTAAAAAPPPGPGPAPPRRDA